MARHINTALRNHNLKNNYKIIQLEQLKEKIKEKEEELRILKSRAEKLEKNIEEGCEKVKMKGELEHNSCITITFGDVAENHVGMEKIGKMAEDGFEIEELEEAKKKFEKKGFECELIDLNEALSEEAEEAAVLIVRKGAKYFCDIDTLFEEQLALEWDTKALFRGVVKNKRARYNLCYAEKPQEPCYEEGKGRIVAFDELPSLNKVRNGLPKVIGEKATDLNAEGNLYYDPSKTGIGFHGDAERKRVVAIRLGASIPLHYQWFHRFSPIGERIRIVLNHGDLYIMSEKATGFDWKRSSQFTLRHAAGADKYLKTKSKTSKRRPSEKETKFRKMKFLELKEYVKENEIKMPSLGSGKGGRLLKRDYLQEILKNM